MEEPVAFGLWCRLSTERVSEIAAELGDGNAPASRRALWKAANSSAFVLLADELGWTRAQGLRRTLREKVIELRLVQSGYAANEVLRVCEVHDVHYAGVLGCPICSARARE